MSAQHTPGPWRATPYSSIVGIAISGGGFVIAGVRSDRPTAEANAHLIVAAPTMLAKLRQIADECANCQGARCDDCADIWQVIDQAEGRP